MLCSNIFHAEREHSIIDKKIQDHSANKWCEAEFHSGISANSQMKVNFCPKIKRHIRPELHEKWSHSGVYLRYEKKLQLKTE